MIALRSILLALALLAAARPVAAADAYPTRPVTIVVPFPPGGIADVTARPPAAAFERTFKQPVVVSNKAGAAGALGTQSVAIANPDSYTLLLGLVSISIIPEVDALFGRPPAFTRDQFLGIARLNADPPLLVVNAELPWKSVNELLVVAIPHVEAGKLRPLATRGATRLAAFPDVPTLKELGYDVEYYLWAGLFAPRGVPAGVVKALRDATRQAVGDPEFKSAMEKVQTPIACQDADEFEAWRDRDAALLADVIKQIGRVDSK